MKSPNKLFECLNAINRKDPTYKYNKKDCSGYMLLMWFSHSSDCLNILNDINEHLFDIPDELVFKFLYAAIPKGNRFIKYDKGDKDKALLKSQQDIIQAMIDEYGYSKKEAVQLYKRYIDGSN